jgi:hypothetical protein
MSGWIVAMDADGTGLLSISTLDDGATWANGSLPGSFPDGVSSIAIDVLDDMHVIISIKMPFSSAESIGYALNSGDDGKTWVSINLPNGDPVGFRTPLDGWQAGGPVDQDLNRSTDGGETWRSVKLTFPDQFKERRIAFSNPVFFGEAGVLPVYASVPGGGPLDVAFFTSQDAGDTWTLAGSIEAASEGSQTPVVVAGPESWLVETSQGLQATSDGMNFSPVEVSGLDPSLLLALTASGPTLWASVGSSSCTTQKVDCVTKTWLERSADSGRTWTTASP